MTPAVHAVRLEVGQAYDLGRAAAFLAGWPPATSTATGADGALAMACVVDDGTGDIGVEVRQSRPSALDAVLTEPPTPPVVAQLRRILGLDLDGVGFSRLGERDPVLRALQERAPGARPVLFPSPYDAAAWAVLSARTPAARAAASRRELCARLGTTYQLAGQQLAALPTPVQLRQLQELPGLPAEKVRRLHAVADAAQDGRLDPVALAAMPATEALTVLKTIRGIGDFYAQLIVVRALPGADLMPTGEPRLLAAAARLFGEPDLSPQRLAVLTAPWSPHRSWAAFLLRTTG